MSLSDKVGVSLLALVTGCIVGAIAYIIYSNATVETFSLRKDSWECTATHPETHSSVMLVGKVMIPQTSSTVVCDNYKRK